VAAQTLISCDGLGSIHKRIFDFLCRPGVKKDYLFEAVDQALFARKLGVDVAKAEELTALLLDAAERASHSANFSIAKHYVTSAQGTCSRQQLMLMPRRNCQQDWWS
jgi:hypothetical protein